MTAAPEITRAPAPHRVAIFSVVALALLMSSLDGTIVATALHAIQHGLNASINWTSWVITAYSVGMVLALSLAGKLSDQFALVPLYAVDRYHISVLGSGTLLTGEGVAVIALSSLAAMGLRRTGYRWPLYIGSVCTAIGIAGLALRPAGLSPYTWLAMTACVIGIGTGLSSPASRNAGLQLAPDQSAALAALRSTGRQVGQIAVVSITTTIIAQSASPGELQAKVFVAFAILLIVCLPVISRVHEHHGAW